MADANGLPDLQTALSMFVQGAQAVGTMKALDQANQQVDQIKSTMTDGMQQRQALDGVARKLVMDMTARGANASTVANVYGSMKPPQFASAEQMMLHGMANGDQSLIDAGQQYKDVVSTEEAKKIAATGQQKVLEERTKGEEARKTAGVNNASKETIQGMKNSAKAAGQPLSQKSQDSIGAFREAVSSYNAVQAMVENNPKLAGVDKKILYNTPIGQLFPDEASAQAALGQINTKTRRALEGTSRIPEQEIARVKKNLPDLSTPLGTFLGVTAQTKETLMRAHDIELDMSKRNKKDVSRFGAFSASMKPDDYKTISRMGDVAPNDPAMDGSGPVAPGLVPGYAAPKVAIPAIGTGAGVSWGK